MYKDMYKDTYKDTYKGTYKDTPAAANEAQAPVVQQPSLQADAQAPEATGKTTAGQPKQEAGPEGLAPAVPADAEVSLAMLGQTRCVASRIG